MLVRSKNTIIITETDLLGCDNWITQVTKLLAHFLSEKREATDVRIEIDFSFFKE